MRWSELSVNVDGERVDFIGDLLLARGAVSIQVEGDEDRFEQELGEIPVWPMARLSAIFDLDATDIESTLLSLITELAGLSLEAHRRDFADQNWELASLERYRAQCIIGNLWIVPDWLEAPDPEAVNIRVNPGLAFGTGEHPTTRGCMRVLYELAEAGELHGKSVLDMGCGSGILAVTAVRLGAANADATDIDPRALEVSVENAQKNGVLQYIRVLPLDNIELNTQFDIIIANILAGTLMELANELQSKITAGGTIILSGLLTAQAERVRQSFDKVGEWKQVSEEDWVTLYGRG